MAFTEILPGIHYVGVNDRTTTRFESLWSLPYGVSYNSYLVIDEKVALIDTVEVSFGEQFIDNIRAILKDRPIDYLVVDHMEPDHSSSIKTLRLLYPEMQIVGNAKTLQMLDGYYGIHTLTREVKEGESISLGQKPLVLYGADGSLARSDGHLLPRTQGTLLGGCVRHVRCPERRYPGQPAFAGPFLGRDAPLLRLHRGQIRRPVQKALQKLSGLPIETICSTHGPVWQQEIGRVIGIYDQLSRYEGEPGVVIAYGSMYGNTAQMAEKIARELTVQGVKTSSFTTFRMPTFRMSSATFSNTTR